MNEKERIIRCVEDFLKRRYELRYNVVKGVTEFRVNDLRFKQWSPLTDRDLKSIVVEEMKEGGESWTNDIRNYIEDFARGCPPATPDGRSTSTAGFSRWWRRHSTSTRTTATRWCRCSSANRNS